jgi:hypothetical protein
LNFQTFSFKNEEMGKEISLIFDEGGTFHKTRNVTPTSKKDKNKKMIARGREKNLLSIITSLRYTDIATIKGKKKQ